jgi:hypothetical protein
VMSVTCIENPILFRSLAVHWGQLVPATSDQGGARRRNLNSRLSHNSSPTLRRLRLRATQFPLLSRATSQGITRA